MSYKDVISAYKFLYIDIQCEEHIVWVTSEIDFFLIAEESSLL